MSQTSRTGEEGQGPEGGRARDTGMLTSAELQRRLEELRTQRARVPTPGDADLADERLPPGGPARPATPAGEGQSPPAPTIRNPEPAAEPSPAPTAEDDYARVTDMLTSPEMQRRLEEARIQRAKVLALREAAKEDSQGGGATAAPPVAAEAPGTVSPLAGKGEPSEPAGTDGDHARVVGMLTSPEMQRRLEEARVQRAKVLALRQAMEEEAEGIEAAAASPFGRDAPRTASPIPEERVVPVPAARPIMRPVLRAPPRPVAAGPAVRARWQADGTRDRRQPWIVSLLVGLVAGLVIGAGVMQLGGWLVPGAPETAEAPEPAPGPGTAGGNEGNDVVAGLLVAEPVAVEPPGIASQIAPSPPDPLPAPAGPDSLAPPADRDTEVEAVANAPGARIDAGGLDTEEWRPSPSASSEPGGGTGIEPGVEPELPGSAAAQRLSAPASADGRPAPQSLVILHLAPDLPQAALSDALAALRDAGLDVRDTGSSRFGVAENEVRFFHEEDAALAERAAGAVAATARDFSAYRPRPARGTLEVWLAMGD